MCDKSDLVYYLNKDPDRLVPAHHETKNCWGGGTKKNDSTNYKLASAQLNICDKTFSFLFYD